MVKFSYHPNSVLFFNRNDTASFFEWRNDSLFSYNLLSGKLTHIRYPGKEPGEMILRSYVIKRDSSSFYLLSNCGLRLFRNDSLHVVLDAKSLNLGVETMISTFILSGGNLWVGTNRGLVLIRDFEKKGFDGSFERYLDNIFIGHSSIDNEGGIWFTTLTEGIYFLPPSQAYVTNIRIPSITSIKYSGCGDHYGIGTYYGDFMLLSGDRILHRYSFGDIWGGIRIKGLKWLSCNEVILGTDRNVYVYSINKRQRSSFFNFIYYGVGYDLGFGDMEEGSAGSWVAGRSAIVLDSSGKKRLVYGDPNPISERFISITDGGPRGCWYATVRRLHYFDLNTGKSTIVAGPETFGSNLKDIKRIKGEVWAATDGNGIFIFSNNKPVAHISSANSPITSNSCQKLLCDRKNRIWVATNKGVNVFDIGSRSFLMSFTANDVLLSNDVKDLDLYNNKAYVATADGISIINIDKFIIKTPPPKVYIRRFIANGVNYADSIAPAFRYFNGTLRCGYTAITFVANKSLSYRYRILNKDTTWNETHADEIELYNLAPGSYELSLCAKKYNSDWSAPVRLTFTILPLWYQTGAFRLFVMTAVALIIGIIVYSIFRFYKRKSDTRRKILESELKAIRLYMNPHFIFNSLSSLQLFILKNKSSEAHSHVSKFAKLIRWIMMYSEKQEITLGDEIDFLKTYIELEQTRLDNGFSLELRVDPDLDAGTTFIPPLVIQPIVENAIKYGLAGKEKRGILQIGFQKNNNLIYVSVEDNGAGRDRVMQEQALSPNKTPSTGIKYTIERLKLLLKGRNVDKPLEVHDLFENGRACGTKVQLIIPILI